MQHQPKIRVLIIDDSSFIRLTLRKILDSDPAIEVVGEAIDPFDAREKIKALNPDVLTLDIQMPKMDGITFLEKLMSLRPMPVVMVSTLTEKGAVETLKCLELGAIDYVSKPTENLMDNIHRISVELCEKVKTAARAQVRFSKAPSPLPLSSSHSSEKPQPGLNYSRLVYIGSSTGGVEALMTIISQLPAHCPPIFIVQHMPEKFTASFAERLNRLCKPHVFEAKNNMKVHSNCVYLAPGHAHMIVEKTSFGLQIRLHDGDNITGHKPSVSVLFDSAIAVSPKHSMALMLTGMGKDGALSMKDLRDAGALTYGQNEESCVVYGMPKAAKDAGAIIEEKHLNQLATTIMLGWND